MKRLSLLFLAIIFSATMLGQKYLTIDIRAKADSIFKSLIGDTLFNKYCTFDTANTLYLYKTILRETHWERLYQNKSTKGKLVKVKARWLVSIPCPKCPVYNKISREIDFELDKSLHLIEKLNLDFIPDFFLKGDSCRLITKEKALSIAKQQNLKQGTEPLRIEIYYDTKQKMFIWKIQQVLSRKKDAYNNDYGEVDVLTIDASTGHVDSHQTLYYGPVY
ncbi:MAG TPA: PepSY domain-containing protein [Bacteroidia bacterium]|nr:PepSY domain-containing protein [Bacteroidia bacterium]